MDDFKEQRKLCKILIRNAKSTFEKRLADEIKENRKAFYSYSRSKLETKETVGPIADCTVLVYNYVGVANYNNGYLSSVSTDDKLRIPEPVQIFDGGPHDRLIDISSPKTMCLNW